MHQGARNSARERASVIWHPMDVAGRLEGNHQAVFTNRRPEACRDRALSPAKRIEPREQTLHAMGGNTTAWRLKLPRASSQ
jgi:hypothetical protein